MRVGIDYLQAVTHWPGVGRYARELVRALVRVETAPELLLFDLGGERRSIGEPALGLAGFEHRYQRRSLRLPRRLLSGLNRLTGYGADSLLGGVDIFHRILLDQPPLAKALTTMAVGELPPALTEADRLYGERLQVLDGLFVASRHAERELQQRYGIDASKIHFVSLGCDHWRRDWLACDHARGEPYLIVLGAIRAERRQIEILKAFESLYADGVVRRLILVGGGLPEECLRFGLTLKASPAQSGVEWIQSPKESDMPALVAGASVLIHLSRGEETAVTPLEAFSFGTAVVTNPGGPFLEALGTSAVYFETHSEEAIEVEALAACIADAYQGAGVESLRRERVEIASGYTWEASARRTAQAFEEVAAQKSS